MTRQSEKELVMFDGKVFGETVSVYGLENGYLDYRALSKIVGDVVLNNNIFAFAGEELDMYLWGITHFGTSWDYVLTDIKVSEYKPGKGELI